MQKAKPPAVGYNRRTFRHDFLASIVVFLVALPLCLGIALASGVPAEKAAAVGLMTGIVGGLVVGAIGGAPLQVSGPAAGLAVIVYELIQQFGWEMVGTIVLLAGLIQLLAGLLKCGQWFRAVSPAVIYGMLGGIGVLIFASQFHVMLDNSPRGSGIANLLAIPPALWRSLVVPDHQASAWAAGIGLLTILVIVLWKPVAPARWKIVPAPLVAIAAATVATGVLGLPIRQVSIPDNLLDAVQLPSLSAIGSARWQAVLFAAASLAFIASAETLLCATAVDQMHSGRRTRYDRELAAQGVANMLCGALGALPITGVIVRSAANVEAGARSRASAFLHGLWLLAFVCLLPFALQWMPTAGLAAILVYTGCKLVNPQAVWSLSKYGKSEVGIYTGTVFMIVATDLLTGVIAGMGLSILKLVYTFSHLSIRLESDPENARTVLYLEGAATFIRLPKLAAALESVPPDTELHVHFEELTYIDHACLELLMNWEKHHCPLGGSLVVDWESLTARFRHGMRPAAYRRPPADAPNLPSAA